MLKRRLIALIGWYQRWWSPVFGDHCRFEPSCSEYARQALTEWGLTCGLALTIWRLLRCQPWSLSGHDPVPQKSVPSKSQLGASRG